MSIRLGERGGGGRRVLISLREKTNQYAKNFQLTDNTITKLHIKEMITCVIVSCIQLNLSSVQLRFPPIE